MAEAIEVADVEIPVRFSVNAFVMGLNAKRITFAGILTRGLIMYTWAFASVSHDKQARRFGALYIEHPMIVGEVMRKLGFGIISIISAILHDVIEDGSVTARRIVWFFGWILGKQIARRVEALSKDANNPDDKFNKIIQAVHRWPGIWDILVIKIVDRLHNLICPYAKVTDDEEENRRNRQKEIRFMEETLGAFHNMCQEGRQSVPKPFLIIYDTLVEKTQLLAQTRLSELQSATLAA